MLKAEYPPPSPPLAALLSALACRPGDAGPLAFLQAAADLTQLGESQQQQQQQPAARAAASSSSPVALLSDCILASARKHSPRAASEQLLVLSVAAATGLRAASAQHASADGGGRGKRAAIEQSMGGVSLLGVAQSEAALHAVAAALSGLGDPALAALAIKVYSTSLSSVAPPLSL